MEWSRGLAPRAALRAEDVSVSYEVVINAVPEQEEPLINITRQHIAELLASHQGKTVQEIEQVVSAYLTEQGLSVEDRDKILDDLSSYQEWRPE